MFCPKVESAQRHQFHLLPDGDMGAGGQVNIRLRFSGSGRDIPATGWLFVINRLSRFHLPAVALTQLTVVCSSSAFHVAVTDGGGTFRHQADHDFQATGFLRQELH